MAHALTARPAAVSPRAPPPRAAPRPRPSERWSAWLNPCARERRAILVWHERCRAAADRPRPLPAPPRPPADGGDGRQRQRRAGARRDVAQLRDVGLARAADDPVLPGEDLLDMAGDPRLGALLRERLRLPPRGDLAAFLGARHRPLRRRQL